MAENDKKLIKLSLEGLGIKYEFPPELIDIAENIDKRGQAIILRHYSTVYDSVAVLFFYRFVEKLENSEIAEKLKLYPSNIHQKLYNFHWNYSSDYEENQKAYSAEKQQLVQMYTEAKPVIAATDFSQFHDFCQIQMSKKYLNMYSCSYKRCGFDNKEEYLKTLYYFSMIYRTPDGGRISSKELALLFDINLDSMLTYLRDFGFLNFEDSMKNKKVRGSQNYEKSQMSAKRTRIKSISTNYAGGSKNENIFRSLLAHSIYEYLDSEKYDIVIGTNTLGILGAKEIDIPVMVFNRSQKQLSRFAVEYNGEYYHDAEEDASKAKLAENRGWVYLPVDEKLSDGVSNSRQLMQKKVNECCLSIKEIVERYI